MEMKQLAEVEWDFAEDDTNWKWCKENATFVHREWCEFILHIGEPIDTGIPYWQFLVTEMREGGCTEDFITKYIECKDAGAWHVLLWC